MRQLNHKELSIWLSVNNHVALYMHEQWWEKLNIKHLLLLLQSNNHPLTHIRVNQHIADIIKLIQLPHYSNSNNQEYRFWLNNFFILKQMALLTGLLLQKQPVKALMSGEIHRYVKQVFSIKKIRPIIMSSHFIAGQVIAFSQNYFNEEENTTSALDVENKGKILLINAAPHEMTSRINLLFLPEPEEKAFITMNLDYEQCMQVQYLIKRLVRLCGFADKTV